ncbi:MAG: 2-isopropylmalate synthase [Varibaculum sp.]|nr:2-isopropylmalate synthase [Varibaculum sp.]
MRTTDKAPVQQPSGMPFQKYRPFHETNLVELPDRTWPDRHVTHAPRWLSTDLRDGNQALITPMDPARKRKMFDLLVELGYKEIEIGFPSASQTDYDFVRSLIEDENAIPDDVCVSVLTQSRADLITRTVESLQGAHRANVHVYNATSPLFREVVFHNTKAETIDLAVTGVAQIMADAERFLGDNTIFGLEYSPEIFIDTELEFALEISERVCDTWEVGAGRELILNLPATVERTTPNVYADQIEWMSRNLTRREHIALSLHPHNDRSCGIAAAELALKAGADRIEGCLLGQGERTGNVDLVVLGLNLFSQGIDPMIDLSNVDHIREVCQYCNQMGVDPRHPYVGDLVYTSFSGSHQDAIKKGFAVRKEAVKAAGDNEDAVVWSLPYLPIDPHDVGRSYEAVVRVNSQSGKGGVAFLMERDHKLNLPRRLQQEFSRIVQRHTDSYGGEVNSESLWRIFADEYLPSHGEYVPATGGLEQWGRFELISAEADNTSTPDKVQVTMTLRDNGDDAQLTAVGNGPIDAFTKALHAHGIDVQVRDYTEHAMEAGEDARAAAYVEVQVDSQVLWGVGIHPSITKATYLAIISALNRIYR